MATYFICCWFYCKYPKCERKRFESDESEYVIVDFIRSRKLAQLKMFFAKKEGSNKLSEFSDWMCSIKIPMQKLSIKYKVESKFKPR